MRLWANILSAQDASMLAAMPELAASKYLLHTVVATNLTREQILRLNSV